MFKERRFLAGLGIGIITGGLLLQLMLTGQESATASDSDERMYTEQEVQQLVKQAKQEANGATEVSDPENKPDDKAEKPTAPATPNQPDASNEAVEPSPPSEPTGKTEPTPSKQPEQPAVSKPDPAVLESATPVVIRIKPGMNLTATAKLLADNGVIDSQSSFIATMKKEKKLVRAGYFAFQGNLTLEQTIDTLTGQPLTEQEANRIKSKS